MNAPTLYLVEKFLRETGIPWSRFGREVARDPRLVHDMRLGREPGPQMRARILAYISHRRADAAQQQEAA